jgi:hypothetical protein
MKTSDQKGEPMSDQQGGARPDGLVSAPALGPDPATRVTDLDVVETLIIARRGTAYIVVAPDPPLMVGDRVRKDGVLHEVTAVEMRPTATPQYVIDGKQLVLLREWHNPASEMHQHGRVEHGHSHGDLPHTHLLRAVCLDSACADWPTHDIHPIPGGDPLLKRMFDALHDPDAHPLENNTVAHTATGVVLQWLHDLADAQVLPEAHDALVDLIRRVEHGTA